MEGSSKKRSFVSIIFNTLVLHLFSLIEQRLNNIRTTLSRSSSLYSRTTYIYHTQITSLLLEYTYYLLRIFVRTKKRLSKISERRKGREREGERKVHAMRATYERRTKREREIEREKERRKEREREERDASRPHQHVNRGELRRARHAFTITRREAPRRNLWRRHTGPLVARQKRRAYLSLSLSLSRSRRDLLLRLAFPPIDRSSQRLFISSPSAIYSSRLYTSFETLSFFLWIIV